MRVLLALVAAVLLAACPASVAANPTEVPLDLAFRARQLSIWDDPAVSPDGRYVVSVVNAPQALPDAERVTAAGTPILALGNRLVLDDLQTGKRHDLTGVDEAAARPVWSPDGSLLAYLSDRGGSFRLWVYDPLAGAARPVAERRVAAVGFGADAPVWRPDGKALATIFVPLEGNQPEDGLAPDREEAPAAPLVLFTDVDADTDASGIDEVAGFEQLVGPQADLGVVDVATGAVDVVVPAAPEQSVSAPLFSPSGRFLAADTDLRFGAEALTADLVVVDLADGSVATAFDDLLYPENEAVASRRAWWQPGQDRLVVSTGDGFATFDPTGADPAPDGMLAEPPAGTIIESFGFTADGATVVALVAPDDVNPGESADGTAVVAIPMDGGPVGDLHTTGNIARRLVNSFGATLWQPSPATVAAVADADGDDGATARIIALSLDGGGPEVLYEGDGMFADVGTSFAGPVDHAFVVGGYQAYDQPPDLFRFAADGGPMRRVTTAEPRWDHVPFGAVETFETEVVGFDGKPTTVRTAVLLPPGTQRGDRLPTIVEVYGGVDLSWAARSFGGGAVGSMPASIFTSRGYAVLLVDAPLSPEGEPGQPARDLAAAVAPQVARAADLGYVDAARVVATGQSYGGYSTALLLATTDVFAAGVAVSGVYDLAGLYGDRDPDGTGFNVFWSEAGQGRMGVPPWDDYDRYLENSPYALAPAVSAPLLIVHGEADSACPVAEAEKMYTALERLGKEGRLLVYPGEGHVIMEWQLENAVDVSERVLDFLAEATGAN